MRFKCPDKNAKPALQAELDRMMQWHCVFVLKQRIGDTCHVLEFVERRWWPRSPLDRPTELGLLNMITYGRWEYRA